MDASLSTASGSLFHVVGVRLRVVFEGTIRFLVQVFTVRKAFVSDVTSSTGNAQRARIHLLLCGTSIARLVLIVKWCLRGNRLKQLTRGTIVLLGGKTLSW